MDFRVKNLNFGLLLINSWGYKEKRAPYIESSGTRDVIKCEPWCWGTRFHLSLDLPLECQSFLQSFINIFLLGFFAGFREGFFVCKLIQIGLVKPSTLKKDTPCWQCPVNLLPKFQPLFRRSQFAYGPWLWYQLGPGLTQPQKSSQRVELRMTIWTKLKKFLSSNYHLHQKDSNQKY